MAGELFGLLTRIRISRKPMDLETAAKKQHLFPLVGAAIGFLGVFVAIVINALLGSRMPFVSAGVLLAMLYYFTGIMHIEGLADFADGFMTAGSQERKREAMKDVHLGVGGVFTATLYLILMFGALTKLSAVSGEWKDFSPLPWHVSAASGLVLAEMSGKLSMNAAMTLGPSAHEGMGSLFVKESSAWKLLVSITIASAVSVMVSGYLFCLVFLGLFAGFVVTMIARRNFGGVSGDAFGAANEIGRLVTLLGWVIAI